MNASKKNTKICWANHNTLRQYSIPSVGIPMLRHCIDGVTYPFTRASNTETCHCLRSSLESMECREMTQAVWHSMRYGKLSVYYTLYVLYIRFKRVHNMYTYIQHICSYEHFNGYSGSGNLAVIYMPCVEALTTMLCTILVAVWLSTRRRSNFDGTKLNFQLKICSKMPPAHDETNKKTKKTAVALAVIHPNV